MSAPTEPASVFLLSDNGLLREALPRLLSGKNIRIAGSALISPQSLEQVASSGASVVLLDASAGLGVNPQFIRQIRDAVPGIPVLVLAMDSGEETFLAVVSAGAAGCLLKESSSADLVTAIRAVAMDEGVCPPRLMLCLFRRFADHGSAGPNGVHAGLSRREQQLVPLIGKGLSNKEIASRMNLSEQTVKNHIHRMLRKVGGRNRQDILESCQAGDPLLPYMRTV